MSQQLLQHRSETRHAGYGEVLHGPNQCHFGESVPHVGRSNMPCTVLDKRTVTLLEEGCVQFILSSLPPLVYSLFKPMLFSFYEQGTGALAFLESAFKTLWHKKKKNPVEVEIKHLYTLGDIFTFQLLSIKPEALPGSFLQVNYSLAQSFDQIRTKITL